MRLGYRLRLRRTFLNFTTFRMLSFRSCTRKPLAINFIDQRDEKKDPTISSSLTGRKNQTTTSIPSTAFGFEQNVRLTSDGRRSQKSESYKFAAINENLPSISSTREFLPNEENDPINRMDDDWR